MKKPTLTVGITYHDEGELLAKCLSTLLGGAKPPDRIIVYDDASADPARNHIPANAVQVEVIRGEKNLGPARARNIILEASQTEFIHYHDADDYFLPTWGEEVYRRLAQGDVDVLITQLRSVSSKGVVVEDAMDISAFIEGGDSLLYCIRRYLLPSGLIYRRESVIKAGGFRDHIHPAEDFYLHVRLAAQGARFSKIAKVLAVRYDRAESASKNLASVGTHLLEALKLLRHEVPAKYADELAEHAAQLASRLFFFGHYRLSRQAFQTARALGRPKFESRTPFVRKASRVVGPEIAEVGAMFIRGVKRLAKRA